MRTLDDFKADRTRSVPPLAMAAIALASLLLAAFFWFLATIPCSWQFNGDGVAGSCDSGAGIVMPLLTTPAVIIGGALAFWRQRWWPFLAGCVVAFVPLCFLFVNSW